MDNIIAHKSKDGTKTQSLEAHLLGTAKIAKENGEKIGFGNVCKLLGLMHDIGKASIDFQNMIINDTNDKVDHSSAGAYYISVLSGGNSENQFDEILLGNFNEILQYVIEAHHGVFDVVFKNDENSKDSRILYRMKRFAECENSEIDEFYNDINSKYDLHSLYIDGYKEFKSSIESLGLKAGSAEFNIYRFYYIRLFLAILKSADIFDTINSTELLVEKKEINCEIKDSFVKRIDDKATSFGKPKRNIDKVRTEISEVSCKNGNEFKTGIYRLNVPTGGGKTIASMRFACHHAKKLCKDRIIYITSFLSVLEQNAGEIKEIFGDENEKFILEHHSNIVDDEIYETNKSDGDEKNILQRAYLLESWDDYIVLSTTVQFFNTLIKVKASNLRRFASLINSVVIIDEVQALPLKVNYIFNTAMNFLKNVMNTTVILCTATQPPYDLEEMKYKLEYGDGNGNNKDIVVLTEEQRNVFKRVKYKKLSDKNDYVDVDDIVEDIKNNRDKSNLVILNTKKAVKTVCNELEDDGSIYYLTTNLCPYHRKKKIKEIRNRLGKGEKIVCVSTQLIEAGVDVDFDRVIRTYAGVDSLVQAAGRCNREGRNEFGEMLIAHVDSSIEKTSNIREIDEKKRITEEILFNKSGEIDISELSYEFFRRYYKNYKEQMEYFLDKDSPTLVKKIEKGNGCNARRRRAGKRKYIINQQFKEMAEDFELIDENTIGVIVPFEDNSQLIENLISKMMNLEDEYDFSLLPEIRKLIRQLQPYTINVYRGTKQLSNCLIYMEDTVMPIYILADGYYDDKYGVVDELENMCSIL